MRQRCGACFVSVKNVASALTTHVAVALLYLLVCARAAHAPRPQRMPKVRGCVRACNRGSSARSRTRQPSPKHCPAPSRATSCRPTCSAAPVRRHSVERLLPPALATHVLRVSAAACRGSAHDDLDLTGDNVEEFAGNKAFLYERDSGRDVFFHEHLRHRPHLSPREALKEFNLQRPAQACKPFSRELSYLYLRHHVLRGRSRCHLLRQRCGACSKDRTAMLD